MGEMCLLLFYCVCCCGTMGKRIFLCLFYFPLLDLEPFFLTAQTLCVVVWLMVVLIIFKTLEKSLTAYLQLLSAHLVYAYMPFYPFVFCLGCSLAVVSSILANGSTQQVFYKGQEAVKCEFNARVRKPCEEPTFHLSMHIWRACQRQTR